MPTASAVTADLIDLATGRAQRTFQALRLWSPDRPGPGVRPAALVRSRFYLRLLVEDRPGVLAEVAHALAAQEISIASVIQHEALEGGDNGGEAIVPLVIMTHTAPTDRFRTALAAIDRLPFVSGRGVYYPVAD
jgi:homoserine dehydrogenase